MTSLDHVADTAAAGQVVRDYLAARGIRTTATLALMAKTESELEKHLMLPLFNGWKTESDSVLRIPPEEQPIVQAILLHMWSICRKQWADSMTPAPSLSSTLPTSPELLRPRLLPLMTRCLRLCLLVLGVAGFGNTRRSSYMESTGSSPSVNCSGPSQLWHACIMNCTPPECLHLCSLARSSRREASQRQVTSTR